MNVFRSGLVQKVFLIPVLVPLIAGTFAGVLCERSGAGQDEFAIRASVASVGISATFRFCQIKYGMDVIPAEAPPEFRGVISDVYVAGGSFAPVSAGHMTLPNRGPPARQVLP